MKIKRLFLAVAALLTTTGCACAAGNDSGIREMTVDGSDWTVYENFTIADEAGSRNGTLKSRSPAYLGSVGKKAIFASADSADQEDSRILAFVRDSSDRSFFLHRTITFKCKQKHPDCAPEDLDATEMAPGIYSVSAASLDEWKQIYDQLQSAPHVARITVKKDFGVRVSTK